MIKIIATLTVKEDKIIEFQATARELVEKSLAEEGNVSYSLNQSLADKNQHAFIEIWKDEAAVEAHKSSEHFTGIFPKLAELADGEPTITLYREV